VAFGAAAELAHVPELLERLSLPMSRKNDSLTSTSTVASSSVPLRLTTMR